MTVEDTVKRATAFVLEVEANGLKTDVEMFNVLTTQRPVEAENLLSDIIKEKQRLNPAGKWDEEEWIIGNLEKKGKKKKKKDD